MRIYRADLYAYEDASFDERWELGLVWTSYGGAFGLVVALIVAAPIHSWQILSFAVAAVLWLDLGVRHWPKYRDAKRRREDAMQRLHNPEPPIP